MGKPRFKTFYELEAEYYSSRRQLGELRTEVEVLRALTKSYRMMIESVWRRVGLPAEELKSALSIFEGITAVEGIEVDETGFFIKEEAEKGIKST